MLTSNTMVAVHEHRRMGGARIAAVLGMHGQAHCGFLRGMICLRHLSKGTFSALQVIQYPINCRSSN